MHIHIRTLFTHDEAGRMVRVNEPGGGEPPRIFVGRTAEGIVWSLRRDVDADLAEELEALVASEEPGEPDGTHPLRADEYRRVLERGAPVSRVWAGPAYRFPSPRRETGGAVQITRENADLLRPHFPAWLEDEPLAHPLLALVEDGQAVSICASVRKTDVAHEAGVETAEGYRGRGYAGRVVTAWADAVDALGAVPLYSTSWENGPSRHVASKLGLVQYGEDLHLT